MEFMRTTVRVDFSSPECCWAEGMNDPEVVIRPLYCELLV